MLVQENAENLVRIASTEFSAAIVDAHLCSMVSGVFCACNKEFWTKIEGNIKMGTDSMQVVGKITILFKPILV